MLRMSKLTDYGIVVMTSMARAPDRIHSAANLAAQTELALPTVTKVLKTLARKRLLESVRGAKGGYMLARAPRERSLAPVLSAMEGPIGMTECGRASGLCLQESGCLVRSNWQRINRVVLEALDRITLEQMTQPIGRTLGTVAFPGARKPMGSSGSAASSARVAGAQS